MPQTTRAKFKCSSINLIHAVKANPEVEAALAAEGKKDAGYEVLKAKADEMGTTPWIDFAQPTVKLQPVYAPDDDGSENHKFWQASPSGEITLSINNPAGAETFELGKEYYVDFTRAD